mmetsp:Transcript_14414/g.23819  ORF Transcript_14414/g.23819 Transcript_14414/m.23819 type:complete len:416 (+) Transcript_14414:89-1336(+)
MVSTVTSFEIADGIAYEAAAEGETNDDINIADISHVIQGMQYAALAITDDKPDTLTNIGVMNPWHIEGLKMITGSEEEAHQPLTYLLKRYMQLECDEIIDVSGMTKGGHFLDTQGYVAHNDEVIVLAFRCTTSIFDWLTNINTTSSEWEVEEDVAQGYSGMCSGFEGLCCNRNPKPRVHTGFYNNFLTAVPAIEKHINPLLQPDQPPRRLYVVGHSLGAGVATLAASYFLLEHDWNNLPHTLVGVTAGSPRTALGSFKNLVEEELKKKQESATMFRIVRNKDVVATVPPRMLGFHHLGRLVFIDDKGHIKLDSDVSIHDGEDANVKQAAAKQQEAPVPNTDDDEEDGKTSKYQKSVARIPVLFRDHMPDHYLKAMRAHNKKLFPYDETECAVCKCGEETCTKSQFLIHKKKPVEP